MEKLQWMCGYISFFNQMGKEGALKDHASDISYFYSSMTIISPFLPLFPTPVSPIDAAFRIRTLS